MLSPKNKLNLAFPIKLLLILLIATSSFAHTEVPVADNILKLVEYETLANAAARRSNQQIPIEHYEIPAELMHLNNALDKNDKITQSLVFKKDGKDFVRWVVNPEDTTWYKDVEKFMLEHGLKPERKTHFVGYQTASRSYIVVDPSSGVAFSIKTSTDRTGGAWKDKKQEFKDGQDIRMISDYVQSQEARLGFQKAIVMYEPLTIGIQSIDQSIVVRDLAGLKNSDRVYLPGFSALHEQVGREIAAKNGSNDPLGFWNEHYVKPMARVAAEFYAKTGVWLDSPHSQNFLVEMTADLKPTGRIVIRDLGDIYLYKPYFKSIGRSDIPNNFSESKSVIRHLDIAFGPLHGNKAPKWISKENYGELSSIFNNEFISSFKRYANIDLTGMAAEVRISKHHSYFGVRLQPNEETKSAMENWPKFPNSNILASCRRVYQ